MISARPSSAQKGAAEGQQKKTRQEASDPSPEAQGDQMLQPAQVDFAAVVDAIQDDVQPVVGLQQGIAAEQFFPGAISPYQPGAQRRDPVAGASGW